MLSVSKYYHFIVISVTVSHLHKIPSLYLRVLILELAYVLYFEKGRDGCGVVIALYHFVIECKKIGQLYKCRLVLAINGEKF